MQVAHGQVARRWHEPIRVMFTVAWVGSLTLWVYFQVLFFYSGPSGYSNALNQASSVLRTIEPLWYVSFFSALAFGLGWYTLSLGFGRAIRSSAVECGLDRLAKSQTIMAFLVGACAFLVNWRLLPLLPFCTFGDLRVSTALLDYYWGPLEWMPFPPVLEQHALIGVLASGVVFLQAWGLAARFGASRRRLVVLTLALVTAGLLVPASGLLWRLPTPFGIEPARFRFSNGIQNALLIGDRLDRTEAEEHIGLYLRTHDDQGRPIRLHDVQQNYRPHRTGQADDDDGPLFECQLCQIPGTSLWTIVGIPVFLDEGDLPVDDSAGQVVEIPRRGLDSRIYEGGVPSTFRSVPTEDLADHLGEADWIVLKVDWRIEMTLVRQVLTGLRERGVRRVDLAAIPNGYEPMALPIPVLDFIERPGVPEYRPRKIPDPRKPVIVVEKWVPPGEEIDPDPRCNELIYWGHRDAWQWYQLDDPGSLPDEVRIDVFENMQYGPFIGYLQGAVAGGAEKIHISLVRSSE